MCLCANRANALRKALESGRRDVCHHPGGTHGWRAAIYASNLLLNAYTHDEIVLGGDAQRLIGLINRMRLFAPPDIVGGAEKVLRAIAEISLKPSIELRQLAKEALSKSLDPDPLLAFSSTCRADLDNVRRTTV